MSEDLTKKLASSDTEKIALILTTVQNLDARVDNLERKVEERLYDPRPIWEKVVADIAQLQQGQQRLEEGQQRLEETVSTEFRQVNKSLRDIYYRLEVLNDTMLTVQARHRDVDGRVRELEALQKPTNPST